MQRHDEAHGESWVWSERGTQVDGDGARDRRRSRVGLQILVDQGSVRRCAARVRRRRGQKPFTYEAGVGGVIKGWDM